jgi:glycosyltransferase involved in cell wall biosynthesis
MMNPLPAQDTDLDSDIALVAPHHHQLEKLILTLRLLRTEGWRAVRDRLIDRLAERIRAGELHKLDLAHQTFAPPVLNLSPLPMAPRRGGAQVQLLDRLFEEAGLRPVVLLYRSGWTWTCERYHKSFRGSGQTPQRHDLAGLVAATAEMVRTDIVHIECLAGTPLALVPKLQNLGLKVILSLHDFSLLCRRPHLLERPAGRFCCISTDLGRCRRCLQAEPAFPETDQEAHRQAGAAALASAAVIVYPSDYLRSAYQQWLGQTDGQQLHQVIPPATRAVSDEPNRPRPGQIAFVGGIKKVKGGALVQEIFQQVKARVPHLRAVAFGEVEPELAAQCRGIKVRGYYRSGRLTKLLQRHRVAFAVLPSIVPESYCLVVDECLRAGVPVVAFDHGAVGERLKRLEAGLTVPLEEGAAGLAQAVIRALTETMPVVPLSVKAMLPTPRQVAEQYLRLYSKL